MTLTFLRRLVCTYVCVCTICTFVHAYMRTYIQYIVEVCFGSPMSALSIYVVLPGIGGR